VATGNRREYAVEGHDGVVESVAATADGKLVSVGRDKTTRTWDLKDGKLVSRVAVKDFPARMPFALSPDGRTQVVVKFQERVIQFIERDTGRVARTITSSGDINHIALSADSCLLAAITGKQTLSIWSTSGEVVHTSQLRGQQNTAALAFSPDSRVLVA